MRPLFGPEPTRVKLALVSLNDSTDVLHWSGLNYHIAKSLERAGATLVRVGPLTHPWTTGMKLRRRWGSGAVQGRRLLPAEGGGAGGAGRAAAEDPT